MIRASAPPITRSYRFIRNFSPHFILLYLLCSLLSSILFYSTLLTPFSFLSPSISSSTSNHAFRSIRPFSLHTNPITITTPSPDLAFHLHQNRVPPQIPTPPEPPTHFHRVGALRHPSSPSSDHHNYNPFM